jgi:hypothetical protein
MRLSAPLYLFDQKDSSLKVVPLGSDPFSQILGVHRAHRGSHNLTQHLVGNHGHGFAYLLSALVWCSISENSSFM